MNLTAQRKRLLGLQAEITVRAERLDRHQRRQTQEMVQDDADRAVQMENDEVIDRLDQMAHRSLEQIDKALRRLDAGIYETCAQCEGPISEARLQQVPETDLCVECAAGEA